MVTWEYAQQAVIGSMLIDPATVPKVLSELGEADFSASFRGLFSAIRTLAADSITVDPVSVLDKMGGGDNAKDLILELMRQTPTAANVSEYIRITSDRARLHRLKELGEELAAAADLNEAADALQRAQEAAIDHHADYITPVGSAIDRYFERLNSGEKPEYMRCGIGCLDSTVHVAKGSYVAIAGYTSHGKSALAVQMAMGLSQTQRVGYFCYETDVNEWVQRLITVKSQVDYGSVQDMDLEEDEVRKVLGSCSQLYDLPWDHIDAAAAALTVDNIREITVAKGYDVIFVDYLQLIETGDRKSSRYEAVSDISRGLKRIAAKSGCAVYALSQLKRADADERGFLPLPSVSDLRESGQIEQDVDAVIFVHAPLRTGVDDWRVLSVPKNRSGKTRRFYSVFDGEVQTFREPTPEEMAHYNLLWEKLTSRGKKKTDDSVQKAMLENEARKRREAEKAGKQYRPGFKREEEAPPPKQEELFSMAEKFPGVVKVKK